MPAENTVVRDTLIEFMRGGSAHADLNTALDHFPAHHYGTKPEGAAHSAWQQLEHIRIALHDLLDFSVNPKYVALKWPDDYWPAEDGPAGAEEWHASIRALKADLAEFEKLIRNPQTNLYAAIPWGDGQTILREVLLAGDHTSYHTGEIVALRQQLGIWKP
ncbi:DinB family protein [Paracidobacterium acidisoli]|uniref:DinB family protein n=1 Tax=Paracidobacterium acidisoli TaxID=2303751 RepID=A0A372IK32_9BACT|nr:DinB family protein [Paracidobacterium acidisoli]MBT9332692.1 DinB family protein [Paracidobacterium acidisoli]